MGSIRNVVGIGAILLTLSLPRAVEAKGAHVVSEGETLWQISRSYGCDVSALQKQNLLRGDRITIGQKLRIPRCATGLTPPPGATLPPKTTLPQQHRVVSGDTLGAIALRYNSSVSDIMAHNDLSTTVIYPGRTLEVGIAKVEVPRRLQSIGLPHSGSLRNATRLKPGAGYLIRRPNRSYGASHTVKAVRTAIKEARGQHRNLHKLAVGDLSSKRGGKITRHSSHQSGRDVDLGFYFKKRPKGYPQSFVVATNKNLDFEATWDLLMALTDTATNPTGVERIFLSYKTQRMLYKLARKHGISKSTLKPLFQYPKGKFNRTGLIRHEPGHDEHMHVRFKCPAYDTKCS